MMLTKYSIVESDGLVPPDIVIWGAGGHATVVADIIRLRNEYTIAGFIDELNPARDGEQFCASKIIGGIADLPALRERGIWHVAWGFGNCSAKLNRDALLRQLGFKLVTLIHPRAVVAAGVAVGDGTLIAAGAVISPGVTMGRGVIVNTSASIDHDSLIGDAVHVSPGAHLAGSVKIDSGSWVGIGAVVSDHISIGQRCTIGAGSVVLQDIPEGAVAYGVPARVVRRVNND